MIVSSVTLPGAEPKLSSEFKHIRRFLFRRFPCACAGRACGAVPEQENPVYSDEQGPALPLSRRCGQRRFRLGDHQFAVEYLPDTVENLAAMYRARIEAIIDLIDSPAYTASVDTHPKGGDSEAAPALLSSAAAKPRRPISTSIPIPNNQEQEPE